MGVIPRVFLHDAALVRIGQLASASDINRSFDLDDPGRCQLTIDPSDALVADVSPTRGRFVVIESDLYPTPWVGKITVARSDRSSGAITVQAKGYDAIMELRLLGARVSVSGTSGEAFAAVLGAINGEANTGIEPGSIAGGGPFAAVFSRQSGRAALDAVAGASASEWWLEYTIANGNVGVRANLEPWRGYDHFGRVALTDPGNCYWTSWIEDGEAFTFSLSVLGGSSSPVALASERAASTATLDLRTLRGAHGYSVDGLQGASTGSTRSDRLVYASVLRSAGLVREAAEAALARQVGIAGAPRTVAVRVASDASIWQWCGLGCVVHLSTPTAFLDGFDGPARIVGAQPMEESGYLELALQLLRPRL